MVLSELMLIKDISISLPVRCQRCESEHRHSDWSQLNERDEFTTHPPKQPLIRQKLAGIHGRTGDQQQHVSEGETRHEQIGDIAHGFHDAKRPNERHITNKSSSNEERVNGCDNDAWMQVWMLRSGAGVVARQRVAQKLYIWCRG